MIPIRLDRLDVQNRRPLMNYAGYNDSWTSVKVKDQFRGWQWGEGSYYDWCDENCSDSYNIVKYDSDTIQGRFKNPQDAMWFAMRWS